MTIAFDDRYRFTLNASPEQFSEEVKTATAVWFYLSEKLSLGQAAEMSGMSQYEFMTLLGKRGIAALRYDADELEREMNTEL